MLVDVDAGNDVFPPGEWAHHKERTVKTLVRFSVERDVKFPVSPRLIGNTHEVEQFLTWFTFSTAIFLEKEVLNLRTIIFKF